MCINVVYQNQAQNSLKLVLRPKMNFCSPGFHLSWNFNCFYWDFSLIKTWRRGHSQIFFYQLYSLHLSSSCKKMWTASYCDKVLSIEVEIYHAQSQVLSLLDFNRTIRFHIKSNTGYLCNSWAAPPGWLIVAWWPHMATRILVNIGSGNGLMPDGTKPSPEPMLIYHQRYSVAFN